MGIAIISSLKDKASINIKESLINNFNFGKANEKFDGNDVFRCAINSRAIKLYTINSELIFADNADRIIDADVFIFISKHRAKEERKCLTIHPIGNFGKNEMGGREKTLCAAPSIYLKIILNELSDNAKGSDFEAAMEATHHGPFLEKPAMFAEIGSTEKEWADKNAGNIIAKSIIDAIKKDNICSNKDALINNKFLKNNSMNNGLKNNENDNIIDNGLKINENNGYESVFVIGGSHYSHVANKAMLKTDFAVGHICAKHNLENLDENLLKEAMEKTVPKANIVLLDWKGLGKEKQRILDLLNKNDIAYKRSDKDF